MGHTHSGWAEKVAHNIGSLIEAAGTTRNEVAQASGIARQTFYRKLGTSPEAFNLRELDNIAEALGVTVIDLIGV